QEWAESGQSSAMRMGSRMQDLASPGMRWDPRAEMMGGEYRPMWRERMSWPGREAYGDERMEMMEGRPYGRGYYGMSGYRTGFSRERPYGMSRQTRGPKNYRRSDERIREDVCDLLCEGHFDARDIEVSVENGEVTLSGSVRSKEAKRMAEDMADDTGGVMQVHNQLRIHEESTSERGNGHPESERRMHQ
ncbi:MAG TPA: BON domain-containing protein, partial [Kofleriaceae bacterium]|nr:BON domain-containing protein [Kofleriaceae bacterium]